VRTPAALSDPPAIADPEIPQDLEKLAFATVRELGVLIKRGKISAVDLVDLTEMYLSRLQRYNPRLKFLITLTEDRARAQAREADADLGKGRYRATLHGIPWERRISWLFAATRPPGVPAGSSSRSWIRTLLWCAGSMKLAPYS
jgi:hypothetical protein